MPKEITWNSLEEKLSEHGNRIDDHLQNQLMVSVDKCSNWALESLREKPIARMEHRIRKSLQESMERSLYERVEEALSKFENLIGGK